MGRGSCSKAIRQANRAAARGKIPAGPNHSTVPGKKWTRKDVLRIRQSVQYDLLNGDIDSSHSNVQQTMKKVFVKHDINKEDIIKSIKVKKPFPSNAV